MTDFTIKTDFVEGKSYGAWHECRDWTTRLWVVIDPYERSLTMMPVEEAGHINNWTTEMADGQVLVATGYSVSGGMTDEETLLHIGERLTDLAEIVVADYDRHDGLSEDAQEALDDIRDVIRQVEWITSDYLMPEDVLEHVDLEALSNESTDEEIQAAYRKALDDAGGGCTSKSEVIRLIRHTLEKDDE